LRFILRSAIENIGNRTIAKYNDIANFSSFVLRCLKAIGSGSFFNRAVFDVLVIQIFFTAYELLSLFIFLSVVYGSIFIGIVLQTVKSLGLVQYLGDIIMGLVVLEMAPLITVFLLALRSSSAVNAEIAVMKVNKEIDALESFGIDPVKYLFVPRIISFVLSVTILSSVFSIVVLFSGFIFSSIIFQMSPGMYADLIAKSVTATDLLVMLLKSMTFGFLISVIPLYHGWRTKYMMTAIPVAVLKGMLSVFMSIILVEVLSLAARLALNYL
jgi:phospholipid/cholesterol/gamma-HCH transport system permease protein